MRSWMSARIPRPNQPRGCRDDELASDVSSPTARPKGGDLLRRDVQILKDQEAKDRGVGRARQVVELALCCGTME